MSEAKGTATKTKPVAPVTSDPEYTIAELAQAAATLFQTQPECVVAALTLAGIAHANVQQARKLVQQYLTREVK